MKISVECLISLEWLDAHDYDAPIHEYDQTSNSSSHGKSALIS
ncbi:hypothetical protein AAZX31_19G100400 [Glycine max]